MKPVVGGNFWRGMRFALPAALAVWVLIIVGAFALAGCSINDGGISTAGTAVSFDGQLCGSQASFRLTDMKDRSQATATIDCGEGRTITISTADSSTSAVIAAQANLLSQLGQIVAQLAVAAAPGPIRLDNLDQVYGYADASLRGRGL